MVAWILVLRNPHFVAVDGQGQFALKLPPGRHHLVLWRPREPELKKRFLTQGAEAAVKMPDEFSAFVDSEIVKWKKVVEFSGARAD